MNLSSNAAPHGVLQVSICTLIEEIQRRPTHLGICNMPNRIVACEYEGIVQTQIQCFLLSLLYVELNSHCSDFTACTASIVHISTSHEII